jgi:hypothetical protein
MVMAQGPVDRPNGNADRGSRPNAGRRVRESRGNTVMSAPVRALRRLLRDVAGHLAVDPQEAVRVA